MQPGPFYVSMPNHENGKGYLSGKEYNDMIQGLLAATKRAVIFLKGINRDISESAIRSLMFRGKAPDTGLSKLIEDAEEQLKRIGDKEQSTVFKHQGNLLSTYPLLHVRDVANEAYYLLHARR